MGIGKEIKVVLALDDSGFSVKTKQAAEVVNALKTGLGELSKSTTVVETSVGDLTKNLKGFTDGFGALQKSLQNTVDQLQRSVTGSFNEMAKTTKEASKVAKDGAQAQIDAKIKTLENELETNRKLLESRGRLHAEMRKMESDQRAASTAAMMNAEKTERGKQAGAPAVITSNLNEADRLERNANAMRQQIMATEQWIATERVAQAERIAEINSLERERKAVIESTAAKETLARVSAAVGKSNAAEVQRVAKLATAAQKESDMAAAKSAEDLARLKKQYAEQEVRDRAAAEQQIRREAQETAAAQKRAAREAAEEARRQNQQVAAMWKGMAQLYASSKIEQGMMGSIKNSDDYSRIVERLDAMGLDGAQGKTNTLAIAKQMREQNPNMSSTDALKMTLATTAGAVSTDPKIIGQIAPEIAKMTTVMTRLFPEQAHNIEQYTQNMMGVMESRGIAKDPEKMLSTLDNLARALMLTQGKLSVQDYETIGRRGSNMQVKSDESILYDIAAASQLKVAGGGGGGGAGGVSTFATMQKQAAKGAEGGILEKRSALENQVEFGIVDRNELMAANGNKPLGRNAKAVAYVGAEEASENMVKFGIDLVNKVKAKLAALPENDTRFFKKGADRTSDLAQTSAFNRFADQTFGNTSRAGFYKLLSSQGSQERIGSEVEAAKQAPGYSKDHEEAMKSWGVAVDKTKASLTDLGIVIGNVLIPILQPCLEWIVKIIDSVKQFAENNPMAGALTTIAAGFGGLILGVQGFMSMMGGSGLLGMLGAFLGIAPKVGGAASFAGGMIKGLGSVFKVFAGVLLAWDIGYMVGTWASGLKIGTLMVSEHLQNMFLDIELAYKRLMLATQEKSLGVRNFLHIDSDDEYKKGMAQIEGQRTALVGYEKQMRITASAKQDAAKTAAVAAKPAPSKAGKAAKGGAGYDPSDDADAATDTSTTDTSGMFQAAHKVKKDRDPLGAALENTKGEIAAQKEKLDSIVLGAETVDSLRRQAAELIEGKRKADEFSAGHLAENRPGADNPKIVALKEETFQKMLLAEQTKAVEFANQRMTSRAAEADAAIERMTEGGVAKQTDAFRALVREMAAAESRIGAGAAAFDKWNKAKNEALFQQASADAANFAAGYGDKNKADAAKLLTTEKERIAAELKAAHDKEDQLFQMHLNTIAKTRAADLSTASTAKEMLDIETEYQTVKEGVQAAYDARRANRREEEARAMESATAKMTREWKDVGKAVDDIGASASNSFVSMITNSLSTGRLAVGDFVKGVLTDIANAKLKETLADPLKDVVNAGGNWVKQNVFGMAGGGGDAASSITAASRATADTTAAAAATTLATTMTTLMMPAVMDLSYAMQAAAANSMGGAAGGMSGIGGAIGSFFGGSGGDAAASGAVENFLFADGGIMTSMGPMELRKYANGGVANSPQVAIYGEAGPEAYVPLPDGRTIPVTMTGGGGQQQQGATPNVQVNVINQTSQPVNAQQGGVRFDGKQFILDVVMTAASSPGPFRQNMKDAMK